MTHRTLVVISLEPWDGVWRRNQYLIDGLLRADPTLRVVFVEPARDLLHDVVSRRAARRGAGQRTAPGYGGRLVLLQPTKWLPRVVGPLADVLLRRALRRTLVRLRVDEPLLWVNDPGWAHLLDAVRWPALYDMTDDWLAADRDRRQHDRLVANEGTLLRRCRVVVVCSTGLYESRHRMRPDVVLIQNAVDVDRYRRPAPVPIDFPDGQVALYVGTLHEDRLDVDLVARTATALHQQGAWCVLLGPNALTEANTSLLLDTPGILLLGPRDYETIPGYLQHARSLLVPHLINEFTDSLDPLKRYEYLAVGRPIVSTAVAGFRDLTTEPGVVVVDSADFPQAVALTVSEPQTPTPHAGIPNWAERVRAMAEVIAQLDEAPR